MNRPLIAALLLAAASAQAAPLPSPDKVAQELIAKLPKPPFSAQEMAKVEECLKRLGSPKAKDSKELTTRLLQDSGGYVRDTAAELIRVLKLEVAALFNEAVKSDPSNVEKLIKSGLARLESQYDRVPPMKCMKPVVVPILRAATPMMIQTAKLMQQKIDQLWQSTIEPKLIEILKSAMVQAVAVAAGPEAKDVLSRTLTKHLLDLPRLERASDKVAAYAKAVASGQNEAALYAATLPELAPKTIDRARFAFDFAIELARVKGHQFVDRGCPSKGGNDDGRKKPEWSEPGMLVNYYAVNKAENLLPGLSCIVDVLLKQVEHLIDTAHTAADGSCAAVPFGGAPVCTSVMWLMQFAAKYAVLVVTKAVALGLAKTTIDVVLLLVSEQMRQKLEEGGAFNRGNAMVDKAFKRAPPIAKALVPAIDKTMKGFLSGEGATYLRIIEAYNASVRGLVEATHKKAAAQAR